ncbi:MAG TPA: type 3 dihydrofolate reductase [Woeseiaceae bacterium]|nr:type 3 dihydrofolate reductase [Woeseiaceae bacterium]
MRISLVVAASKNNVIGRDRGLPWHLPDDLRHFKRLTVGKPVIMGRRTFESIGRPLPDRRNIVMTRDANYAADGCDVVTSVEEALDAAQGAGEVMVIGGGQVYRDFLPHADRVYLTRVQADVEGDTYFRDIDRIRWRLVSSEHHDADEKHAYAFDLMEFERQPA